MDLEGKTHRNIGAIPMRYSEIIFSITFSTVRSRTNGIPFSKIIARFSENNPILLKIPFVGENLASTTQSPPFDFSWTKFSVFAFENHLFSLRLRRICFLKNSHFPQNVLRNSHFIENPICWRKLSKCKNTENPILSKSHLCENVLYRCSTVEASESQCSPRKGVCNWFCGYRYVASARNRGFKLHVN